MNPSPNFVGDSPLQVSDHPPPAPAPAQDSPACRPEPSLQTEQLECFPVSRLEEPRKGALGMRVAEKGPRVSSHGRPRAARTRQGDR